MNVTKQKFGVLSNGEKVNLFTVSNGGLSISVSALGAALTSLRAPAKNGRADDLVLGYSSFDGYASDTSCFGVTVGPIANRVSGAAFTIDGVKYTLENNEDGNCLHSSREYGMQKTVWRAKTFKKKSGDKKAGVIFYCSFDARRLGFPGNIQASVTYTLTEDGKLIIDYYARPDAPMPINMTNHSYFNLGGQASGSVLNHEVKLNCSSYIPVNERLIPTGEIASVENTPFDFRKAKTIGRDIDRLENGYDHCFALDKTNVYGNIKKPDYFAEIYESESGRVLKCASTQPGAQFYTMNIANEIRGKAGISYKARAAFCLETEHFPDSPNQSAFPSCIASPDAPYKHQTIFSFSAR